MRKQTSLRRWKARCRLGEVIPRWAIEDYRLDQWFDFFYASAVSEHYFAVGGMKTRDEAHNEEVIHATIPGDDHANRQSRPG